MLNLADDIWSKVFTYTSPNTLCSIRTCCKHFHILTNPRLPFINRHWQYLTRLLIKNDTYLNVIDISDNYHLSNWFDFYLECRKLANYLRRVIMYRIVAPAKPLTDFLTFMGIAINSELIPSPKLTKYIRIYSGCVESDCPMICGLLLTISDVLKQFGEPSLLSVLPDDDDESGFDRLLTWFLFEAIEFGAVGIIDYLLSLKQFKMSYIHPTFHQTALMHAIHFAQMLERKNKLLITCLKIIEKFLKNPKMTPNIINKYTRYNRTALGMVMGSQRFYSKILPLLLERGADINLRTDHRNHVNYNDRNNIDDCGKFCSCTAALTAACCSPESIDLFKMIINTNKESLFDRDCRSGMTTLMHAVDSGHYNIVKYIVSNLNRMKDEIRRKERQGICKDSDCKTLTKIDDFINAGKVSNGYTAYFIACDRGLWAILKYLIWALNINVAKCYLKEFSCIGYRFTGSEAAKAKGNHKLARWLYRREMHTPRPSAYDGNNRYQHHGYHYY